MATGNIHRELGPARRDTMTDGYDVESAILQHLDKRESCTFEELARMLAGSTLNQIFFGVARLSREGKILLRHPAESPAICHNEADAAGQTSPAPPDAPDPEAQANEHPNYPLTQLRNLLNISPENDGFLIFDVLLLLQLPR